MDELLQRLTTAPSERCIIEREFGRDGVAAMFPAQDRRLDIRPVDQSFR
jgi:hypothetical protein